MILDFIPNCRGQESDNSNTSSESHLSFIGEIEDICVPPVEKRKLDPEESSYLGEVAFQFSRNHRPCSNFHVSVHTHSHAFQPHYRC